VSYHPEVMDLDQTLKKVIKLLEHGFQVGVFGVLHPNHVDQIKFAQKIFKKNGIDFRTKEYLGLYKDKLSGTYTYPDAVFANELRPSLCKTNELLIDPFGDIFRCHHDLYNKFGPIGNILDDTFEIIDDFRRCEFYGNCNPCDVKLKNNRYQKYGHTSVEIKLIK
jgi:sulfatase maturation enzyme AslB (radical SAM superfamily)